MKRQVPNKLLDILENWLCGSYACVNGAIYGPTFLQSSLVCDRVLSCRQFSLQSTSMMFLSVANFIVTRM